MVLLARDIKLAHSVFALPFAILASFLARPLDASWTRFGGQLALVVGCMVAARTWAMLFNRIADRRLDAANPRTRARALAAGLVSTRQAWAVALGAAGVLIALAAGFLAFDNAWPVILSVPVLAWIAFYSLTKRFTVLCHVFLGGALAASPLAAALAIHPPALGAPTLWFLALMVMLWVAGFDVIYALQDLEFDRQRGLSSIPARLGARGAAWCARALHLGAFAALVCAARSGPRFGMLFSAGIGAVGALLIVEHVVLARQGLRGLNVAFFTLNGVVSLVLGLAGVIDLLT